VASTSGRLKLGRRGTPPAVMCRHMGLVLSSALPTRSNRYPGAAAASEGGWRTRLFVIAQAVFGSGRTPAGHARQPQVRPRGSLTSGLSSSPAQPA
jgi:hypothetical protein